MVMEGNGTDSNVLFLDSAKEILMLFAQEKNISRTYQLYKNIFAINQNGYSSFKGMWKELNIYQSLSNDIQVAKFLYGLYIMVRQRTICSAMCTPIRSVLMSSFHYGSSSVKKTSTLFSGHGNGNNNIRGHW